jgi:hypothetical protein
LGIGIPPTAPQALAGDSFQPDESITTQVLRGPHGPPQPLAFPLRSPVLSPMPRDFITLSDMRQSVLGIECALCQRREQFDVEALKREHGSDVKMPELLSRLVADCPRQRQRAFSIYDRCRAVYDRASLYSP